MRARLLLPTLQGYRTQWLGNDLVAGVAAGAVVIPQAMAYASIADLPVQVGLYTCIVPLIVYAFLGGSRAMSVSTTSTIATLTATTMASAGITASTSSTTPQAQLVTLALMVGLILLLARVLRLGGLIENINEATLVGIKVGLGLVVALGQVPKLLGVEVSATGDGFFVVLNATIAAVPAANLATVVLSAVSIAILIVLRRLAPSVPGQLVVVVLGIVLAAFGGLVAAGVTLVGPVPSGLPAPALPPLDHVAALLPGALAIALMAFIESAAVARGIRVAGESQVDVDRELLAVGAASVAGSFFGSLPAAGGFSQSAVNLRAGARSQVSSLVTAALAIMVAIFLSPVLANLPQAVLASMVIVAVTGLIDVPGLVRFWRISRLEFWIAISTAVVGLVAGLLAAVITGVVVTLGLVLRELNHPRFDASVSGGTLTVTLHRALYTANVFVTQRAIEQLVTPGIDTVVVDATAVDVTSLTVLDAFADFDSDLEAGGVTLRVVGLGGAPLAMAEKTEWWRMRQQIPPGSGVGRAGDPADD